MDDRYMRIVAHNLGVNYSDFEDPDKKLERDLQADAALRQQRLNMETSERAKRLERDADTLGRLQQAANWTGENGARDPIDLVMSYDTYVATARGLAANGDMSGAKEYINSYSDALKNNIPRLMDYYRQVASIDRSQSPVAGDMLAKFDKVLSGAFLDESFSYNGGKYTFGQVKSGAFRGDVEAELADPRNGFSPAVAKMYFSDDPFVRGLTRKLADPVLSAKAGSDARLPPGFDPLKNQSLLAELSSDYGNGKNLAGMMSEIFGAGAVPLLERLQADKREVGAHGTGNVLRSIVTYADMWSLDNPDKSGAELASDVLSGYDNLRRVSAGSDPNNPDKLVEISPETSYEYDSLFAGFVKAAKDQSLAVNLSDPAVASAFSEAMGAIATASAAGVNLYTIAGSSGWSLADKAGEHVLAQLSGTLPPKDYFGTVKDLCLSIPASVTGGRSVTPGLSSPRLIRGEGGVLMQPRTTAFNADYMGDLTSRYLLKNAAEAVVSGENSASADGLAVELQKALPRTDGGAEAARLLAGTVMGVYAANGAVNLQDAVHMAVAAASSPGSAVSDAAVVTLRALDWANVSIPDVAEKTAQLKAHLMSSWGYSAVEAEAYVAQHLARVGEMAVSGGDWNGFLNQPLEYGRAYDVAKMVKNENTGEDYPVVSETFGPLTGDRVNEAVQQRLGEYYKAQQARAARDQEQMDALDVYEAKQGIRKRFSGSGDDDGMME